MKLGPVARLAALVVALAGCTGLSPLATHGLPSAGGVGYDGTVRISTTCVWLETGSSELNLVWPQGFELSGNPLAVTNAAINLRVTDGDVVTLDIGPVHQEHLTGCPDRVVGYVGEVRPMVR